MTGPHVVRILSVPYVVTIRDADEWRNFEPSIRPRKIGSISCQDSLGPPVRTRSIGLRILQKPGFR